MTIDERLDRLTVIVERLTERNREHTDQIRGLIEAAEKHQEETENL
jgi:hypothetical protein